MTRIARKSDGRRIFTDEFRRKQIGRVLHGELTLAELSRKLGIARSLLQRWKRLMPSDGDDVGDGTLGARAVPASALRGDAYVRQLQVLIGKQSVELELLRAEIEALRRGRRARAGARW